MLTVLMPISSVDDYLPIAIDSIREQTFKEYICYILCGQLNESELGKLKKIISNDSRFIIKNLKLDGIAFALNYGLNLVETKYVARMDGDDISHPQRFEKQLRFLEENSRYVMVGSKIRMINENGDEISQKFKFYRDNKNIRKALRYRMPLCHPVMMFRTSTLMTNKGYMYGNSSEDHELYLRIVRDNESLVENLSDILLDYRRSDNQLTNIANAKKSFQNIGGFLFTEFLKSFNFMYLVGIMANHPLLRKIRSYLRGLKSLIFQNK